MNVQTSDGTSFGFRSIHGFDFIEPLAMRYVDPSYSLGAHMEEEICSTLQSQLIPQTEVNFLASHLVLVPIVATCPLMDLTFKRIPIGHLLQFT